MHDFDSEVNERKSSDFNMNRVYPLPLLQRRNCNSRHR